MRRLELTVRWRCSLCGRYATCRYNPEAHLVRLDGGWAPSPCGGRYQAIEPRRVLVNVDA